MANCWDDLRTDETQRVEDVLRKRFPRVDAYRFNKGSIRVRVIDPDFKGVEMLQRYDRVRLALEPLPRKTKADIISVYPYTPTEIETTHADINHEFAHPGPSRYRKKLKPSLPPGVLDWHELRNDNTRLIETALRGTFPGTDAYQPSKYVIRLRVIDPSFEGMDLSARDEKVESLVNALPEWLRDDVTTILCLSPSEANGDPRTQRTRNNLAFENPELSLLS